MEARQARQPHELRRHQLLSAAAAHFRRKGYSATSTRELADALGIQKATLYYHVKRKSDLLQEICFSGLTRMQERVAGAIADEPVAAIRLQTLIRTHLETALSDPDIYWTMLMEFRALREPEQREVARLRGTYRALVEETIADAQRAGELRADIEAHYLALALLNLLSWTIFWYRPDGGLEPSELAEVYYRLFVGGARG